MDTPPQSPDPTLLLPRDSYYQLIHTLRAALPPPVIDSPEDLARRDNAAIAHVASLLPATADEASVAAQLVAANAAAMDCLRLAQEHRGDPKLFLKSNAMAISMMRQAQTARTLLQRVQAERQRLAADGAATDKAAWTEYCAIWLMTDALGGARPAAVAEPPPPAAQPQAEEPVADPNAEAEQYAILHPQLAAHIYALGGLPETVMPGLDPTINPPAPELVQAIITGNSPALRALDTSARQQSG